MKKLLAILIAVLLAACQTKDSEMAKTDSTSNENWTPEFREFCQKYMVYVDQYPGKLHAGCCNIDHPSNDILKEGWKGESLLFCDGQEIV